MRGTCRHLDINGDGKVSAEEFQQLLTDLGAEIPMHEAATLVATLVDTPPAGDAPSEVTFEQLLQFQLNASSAALRRRGSADSANSAPTTPEPTTTTNTTTTTGSAASPSQRKQQQQPSASPSAASAAEASSADVRASAPPPVGGEPCTASTSGSQGGAGSQAGDTGAAGGGGPWGAGESRKRTRADGSTAHARQPFARPTHGLFTACHMAPHLALPARGALQVVCAEPEEPEGETYQWDMSALGRPAYRPPTSTETDREAAAEMSALDYLSDGMWNLDARLSVDLDSIPAGLIDTTSSPTVPEAAEQGAPRAPRTSAQQAAWDSGDNRFDANDSAGNALRPWGTNLNSAFRFLWSDSGQGAPVRFDSERYEPVAPHGFKLTASDDITPFTAARRLTLETELSVPGVRVPRMGPCVIGANPAHSDVLVDVPTVSGKHAIFQYCNRNGRTMLTVTDAQSTNGTFRNGSRLTPWTPADLVLGDIVTLGTNATVNFTVQVRLQI